ncbi:MAG TPA: NADH-quinone oxidoreductase subunit C [Anaerolineales bacterium]|nr:NADH-quinone oxidoreductase subunit C [Anaerolineales bacterium]
MKIEQSLQQAEQLLAKWTKETTRPETDRLDISIPGSELRPAVSALQEAHWGYLSAITGLDLGTEPGQLEALYHFCSGAAITTLRIRLPRAEDASLPTIEDILPSATFFEREMHEMLGFTFEGVNSNERLFIPDDWPEDVFPLRADFQIEQASAVEGRRADEAPEEGIVGENTFVVPIGPQHPALKEPGHFEFTMDGEIVTAARMRLGYAHRGIEKAAESRNWIQNLYLFERVCGICSHTHALAYSLGVEKLAQVEASPRAQAIREVVAGMERIHSHLLWLGVAAHEAGFDTLFMYSWRDRETIMNLLEQITGNRVNYSANVLGGVKCDIGSDQARAIKEGLNYLERRINHYLEVVTTDTMFLNRTRGIGTISCAEAERFGLLGPTARASGLLRDVRVEAPYGAYRQFPVSGVTETNGDLEARCVVRLKELLVTCFAIRAIIDNLPAGPLTVRVPRKIPAGETISRVEAPRGELFYYIKSNGGEHPARVHIRTPSLCNWVSVLEKAVGRQLADVPMLIAGMDPCFSCNDRLITTVGHSGTRQTLSWKQLRQYGIEAYNQR